eukprot:TRINITY_DN481_c0_g2_i1.p1 TRINITY_DN481_c0_g2~~TRINITY_DN481_c0_g2_i1.p1  ORF type:complete len:389 (-),score=110.18 TRINITY_DN481_c0_g2_i1:48-1052(-)
MQPLAQLTVVQQPAQSAQTQQYTTAATKQQPWQQRSSSARTLVTTGGVLTEKKSSTTPLPDQPVPTSQKPIPEQKRASADLTYEVDGTMYEEGEVIMSPPPNKPPPEVPRSKPHRSPSSVAKPTPASADKPRPQQGSKRSRKSTTSGSDNNCIIVVVGSGAVGKSALTISYVKHNFVEAYDPTIEDSYRKQETVDGQEIVLDILDTAGQEEFSAMRDKYMRSGDGFLLVFSLTCRQSWEDVPPLLVHIREVKDRMDVPVLLVANKVDIPEAYQVDREEAAEWATRQQLQYMVTSAKLRINVDEAFAAVVRLVRQDRAMYAPVAPTKKKRGCMFL